MGKTVRRIIVASIVLVSLGVVVPSVANEARCLDDVPRSNGRVVDGDDPIVDDLDPIGVNGQTRSGAAS